MSVFDAVTFLPPLLVVLVVFTAILVLSDWVGGRLAPHDWDRPPMLVDMRPDPGDLDVHLHLSLLDQHQRLLAASYVPPQVRVPDPTPVDPSGRVQKIGVDHWRCPSCRGLTYGTDPQARCFPCEDMAENIPARRVKIHEWGGVALGEEQA